MTMSIDLNIDIFGGKSVLPVTCGSSRGTAFYIGDGKFLTAWHVVSEAETLEEPISLKIEEESFFCQLIKLDEMDVAILFCEGLLPDITPIELLKTDFREDADLEIVGYPQEIGNGIDYFGVKVKNLKELKDKGKGFDVMVLRTDAFGFHSYSGFSGSPVLNKKGVAIGVVTDQMYNTLGYTSIASIAEVLTKKKVRFSENADNNDMRAIGLGFCENLADEACKRMKSRYREEDHVKDKTLETQLEMFCGYEVDRWEKKFREEMNQWYHDAGSTYKDAIDALNDLKDFMIGGTFTYKCAVDLEILLNKRVKATSDNFFVVGKKREDLNNALKWMEMAQDAKNLSKERFMYIHGDAGSGKTHHMCHFTQTISKKRNVYLLFGTDFDSNKLPTQTIREVLHWDDENIMEVLNSEMEQRDRYATFIIDALNEGQGTHIWNSLLPALKAELEKYPRLKLIVTVRSMESNDMLRNQFIRGWKELTISGFTDLHTAIQKFFDHAGIHENVADYIHVKEFRHPLFLKIFCQVYHHLPTEYRKDIDILLLYELYYKSMNDEVSRQTEEDPERMVTLHIMTQLGIISLLKYYCCDIPRKDVVKVANELCDNRLWSRNLYHSLLKANLLMEYRTREGMKTSFQYDSMGDYLRAYCIMMAYKDDNGHYTLLKRIMSFLKKDINQNQKTHILNTVKTFLSVWNPPSEIWHYQEFKNGIFTHLLLESLKMRNMKSKRSTLPDDLVASIVLSNDNYINPSYLLTNFSLFRDHLMEPVHEKLMSMRMVERDERWTINVNRMQDDYSFYFQLRQMSLEDNKQDVRAYLRILCWLMTASHPQLRNHVRRVAQGWLRKYSELCTELIEKFHTCDDPYVLRGVYSAIYGVLLVKRDCELSHRVAEMVFKKLFENQRLVPKEIETRSWTLKILEFDHYLNPEDTYWENATPPYLRDDNLMLNPEDEAFGDDTYFGDWHGAKSLHYSLFHWDFNRYIIGTNSHGESPTYIKDGEKVILDEITKAVAYRIKHIYGYSKALSSYDEHVGWDNRVHRQIERIGKKYQWIALGEVKAYLCDTCQMQKDWWDDKPPVEIPYPWYDSRKVTFEPTLTLTGNRSYLDQQMFEEIIGDSLLVGEPKEWLNSRDNLPEPYVIVKDKKGEEWVNIVGYQKKENKADNDKRDTFVFICPCLVKNENVDEFENWAKDQCFYGRWMPEDTGHYEYFWNEFPWSDSYKSMEFEEEQDIYGHGRVAPCKVKLPYATQLQEYYDGIEDEEEFEGMIYMPSAEMFEFFELHTAERGVTRDSNGDVVALCRNIQGDMLDTLVMKRELLNQYLEAKNMTLFYCMLAEKRLTQEPQQFFMQRLSCCMKYVNESDPVYIQPMTDERDFPQPSEEEDDIMESQSLMDWLRIEQEGDGESIVD